ncbi:MAG: ABC-type multidrug transport system ATPase subunit [Crocinitomicaceae bacterium]|jgi:ABC-type multidrug transport system ATPase subunit/uncharacterized tellurite resistance protein B-like protein
MSERILRALMQLFAIIAKVDEVQDEEDDGISVPTIQSTNGRIIIESFLKSELSSSDVNRYLTIFEDFLNKTRGKLYSKKGGQKRTSLQAVKVLRICSQINEELTQRQKVIVLVRIFEFISSDHSRTEKELDFVKTAADAFNISPEEYEDLHLFIEADAENLIDLENHVYYTNAPAENLKIAKHSVVDGLDAPIHIINIQSVKALLFRYYGKDELIINGQIVASNKTHLFNNGSTIRTAKSAQIYYSDLVSKVSKLDKGKELSFEVSKVLHSFGGGNVAIRKMSFTTNSGNMIGVMGGSGTGKTTLMNILNGKVKPSFGTVKINGINLHKNSNELDGIIGNVSQSDLLIEELSVFQNLFFAAKLSMGGETKQQLTKKVVDLLISLGLYEQQALVVGSPLEKVISGGQRKRLNIALELIREPQILFVDEPTSGLSSRDSENIMDLLKELSLRGTLVFVVIHQPSSNIFKLFDRLLIMDIGGHLVYDGIPLNALVHFKTFSYQGNAHERECSLCGNVNPEQIFNIIDAKVVDEFGNETRIRKKGAEDWHKLYIEHRAIPDVKIENAVPEIHTKLPSSIQQFRTYLVRDFLSKISNKQYLLVNGLVAPALALILSFFIKYFNIAGGEEGYSFYSNENIPQYIFIAVIVAIFLGLTVAAEEINKDKKILAREHFLNLSRSSYLFSKVAILFAISALQTLLFISIGNFILEIHGMYTEYWLILFSTACLSNLVGLNISSAFNSAKVIYIIVPLLIIPQLLFSGVIVKFDKLHPSLSDATKVPWVGNMMVSRWAYEALAVEQASNNKLENYYFNEKVAQSQAKWKKDFWFPEMKKQMGILVQDDVSKLDVEKARSLLINEIEKEDALWGNLGCVNCVETLNDPSITHIEDYKEVDLFLDYVRLQYNRDVNKNNDSIQAIIDRIGVDEYKELQRDYFNESLHNIVLNKTEEYKLIISGDDMFQNDEPIYNLPKEVNFLESHFYAPKKYIFGFEINTYWSNLIVIWVISILTYIILYFDLLRKVMETSQRFMKRLRPAQDAE